MIFSSYISHLTLARIVLSDGYSRLVFLRLSSVGFATLFATTISSNYPNACTITAKLSAGKVNWAFIVICWSPLEVCLPPCIITQFFPTPIAVPAPLGKRALASLTSQLTEDFSAMRAFKRHKVPTDSWPWSRRLSR
jgi:hypothetical protein